MRLWSNSKMRATSATPIFDEETSGCFFVPMRHVVADLEEVQERAQASLLGMAIGDALGATVEFMTPTEIMQTYGVLTDIQGGGWLKLVPGQVTDDTQMSLCIARSIAACGWSPRDIAERFAEWLRSKPPDVGGTCRRGIRRYMQFGSLSGPPSNDDGGNGAVMRMTPVAIASLADEQLLRAWAVEQAHLTHNHPLSDAACVLFGDLMHLACLGRSREVMRQAAQLALLHTPAFGYANYRGLCSAYVVDTMQTVLHHFFRSRSFEDCLVNTVNQGGDADTAGAIVGAIAGAYYGLDAIPKRWLKKLDSRICNELLKLASSLVSGSPLGQRSPIAGF
jgi:ADP-ribosyl-[dinitrogen reductase] hydrolase